MPGALANEALHYWKHVQRFRVVSVLAHDRADLADELSLLAQHSEHPVIRRDVVRLLAPAVHADAK
jgi:hypothetical protein